MVRSDSAGKELLGYCYGLRNLSETSVLGDGNVNSYPKVIKKKKKGNECSQMQQHTFQSNIIMNAFGFRFFLVYNLIINNLKRQSNTYAEL